ncbi:FAD-dependent oxidoreductase [Rhodopila sp.]|uniref:FAD-dependent oxidoreductase n=1 Tax=Rhodopila sp. TaxID=2480087 RepID=UPI003D09EC2B
MTELAQPWRWRLDRPSFFEKLRVLDPKPHPAILRQARRYLTRVVPIFHAMRIAESWGGMIDVTPDGIPVISAVDSVPGFFIAASFTGHGFGIASSAGG